MLRTLILAVSALMLSGIANAQNTIGICDHLAATGRVSLIQDVRLSELLGSKPKVYYANLDQQEPANKVKIKGYRIRVFSGNQQNVSKTKAYKIQDEINAKMPDLSTYVSFKTPNWRIMVGDYRTSEEANSMLRVLRKEFPSLGKEMFVVSEDIEL